MGSSQSRGLTMYVPVTVGDGHSHLSMQDAAHSLSMQHAAQQRAAAVGNPAGAQAWMQAGGGHLGELEAIAIRSRQQLAHVQHPHVHPHNLHTHPHTHTHTHTHLHHQQHLGAGTKRPSFEMPERSGVQPTPEPPQVRTMTFVCDLFSPHEGQISLQILADTCNIVTSGFGIVGLSCQLSSAEGTRVVKRGQVKDARRHFAHQAQLRLSLASSPNLSVKVFSTGEGRVSGMGCRV
jgi:hypothetical protein